MKRPMSYFSGWPDHADQIPEGKISGNNCEFRLVRRLVVSHKTRVPLFGFLSNVEWGLAISDHYSQVCYYNEPCLI